MSVLYIKEHGTSIGIANERVQVRKKKKLQYEMPLVHLERLVLMVPAYITGQAVRFMMEHGIEISYLSQNGKFYGQFSSGSGAHVQLRLAQFRNFNDAKFRLRLAKCFVRAKVNNMLALWRRQRQRKDLNNSLEKLAAFGDKVDGAAHLGSLLGLEGSATAMHYRLFRSAILPDWKFTRRAHHPSPDPINAMLSFGYTLLYSRMASLLQIHGFDPYLGYFHEPKRGHAALASDLIEEWRSPVVDSLVLRLVNTSQILPTDFRTAKRKCTMNQVSLQKFTEAFEKRLQSFNTSEGNGGDPIGGLEGQVRQLARVLLGKQRAYMPIQF